MKTYNGEKQHLLIRRLKCTQCGRLHNELPDILVPRKHYQTEVIENVVDDICTPDNPETSCYPCERTMARWKQWINQNKAQIDGHMRSVAFRLLGFSSEFLNSGKSLLVELRSRGGGWLASVIHFFLNSCGRFLSTGPPENYAPA